MKPLSNFTIAICFGILGLLLVGCSSNGPNNPASSEPTVTLPPPPPELIAPYSGMPGNLLALSLRWEEIDGAECYQVHIATSEDVTADLVNEYEVMENITGVAGLDQNSDYYWRVRAKNNGGYGDWSPTWSFSTGDGTPPNSIEGSWKLVVGEYRGYEGFQCEYTVVTTGGFVVLSLGSDNFDVEGERWIHKEYWSEDSGELLADTTYTQQVNEDGSYTFNDSTITISITAFNDPFLYTTLEKSYFMSGDTLLLDYSNYPNYIEGLRFVRN